MKSRTYLIFVSIMMFATTGCIGEKSFSMMARTGDTVALAVGGSPVNEVNSFVNKNNMQVKITDSSATTYNVKLRYLLKLYSDPANAYNYNSIFDYSLPNWLSRYYIDPNQGLWTAVVDLTDPNTGVPLPLAVGPATFEVVTADLDKLTSYWTGNLNSMAIEILPGIGSPHPFNQYGDIIDLEPLPQFQVRFNYAGAPNSNVTHIIGGIEFILDYDKSYFDNPQFPPLVLGNINDPFINVFPVYTTINGAAVIKVMILSPVDGVMASNNPNVNRNYLASKIKDLKVTVTWDPSYVNGSITAANYNQVFQISGYKVVDLDGNPIDGSSMVTLVDIPLMN